MGSSKKHKHDRDHKKKKKRHSHSRSRSRDRHEKSGYPAEADHPDDYARSSKRRRRDEEEDSRRVVPSRRVEEDSRRVTRHMEEGELAEDVAPPAVPPSVAAATSSGAGLSLSIEETNRLRAKLGLKPLSADSGNAEAKPGSTDSQDIHKPAINLAEQKRQKELREKLALAREKRKLHKKLGKVKALGESDSDEDSAAQWVIKNRKIQQEKAMAEKRAKLLDEMDEEFGIGSLVEEAFGKPKEREYSAKDLTGLRVEHAIESFKDGRTTILTLQDKGVLADDDDDVLVNVNIIDDESAAKNLERKKAKPDYKPYEDSSVDEYGMMKPKDVLNKYDEEIDGIKKESFTLGARGKYNAEHERRMQEFKTAIQEKADTLSLAPLRPASEYFTEHEMVSFKKVTKKVRKIRKKPKMVTADDLIPLKEDPDAADLGSRGARGVNRRIKQDPDDGPSIPGLDLADTRDVAMDLDESDLVETQDLTGPEQDLTNVKVDEDEAGQELELALHKARRLLKKQKGSIAPEQIAASIPAPERLGSDEEEEVAHLRKNITLNQTSEFCRSLGDIPTYGQAGNRVEDEDELLDFERELEEERRRLAAAAAAGGEDSGWQEVEIDVNPAETEGGDDKGILDDEPMVGKGMGAALALAVKKGYIKEETKVGAHKKSSIESINYSIEDKRYDDLDDKFRNKGHRYMMSGAVSDFAEIDGYRPDIKITYCDDMGREMNSKEAFRYLSHRFHGKGSGKSKVEKRSKKQELEQLMKTMGSSDTPLNTASMLEGKLLKDRVPYLVLSGSGKTQPTLSK